MRLSRIGGCFGPHLTRLILMIVLAAAGLQPHACPAAPPAPKAKPSAKGGGPYKPLSKVRFLAWDYDALGFHLSPGENVVIRYGNYSPAPIDLPVDWTLETCIGGRQLARGSELLKLDAGEGSTVGFRIELPAGIPEGNYLFTFRCPLRKLRPTEGIDGQDQIYFEYLPPAGDAELDLVLLALLDNVDGEGYVRSLGGEMRRHITAYQSLHDGAACDAAVVAAEEAAPDDPIATSLDKHIEAGGAVLFYGKPAAAFDELLPVVIDRANPHLAHPQTLVRESGSTEPAFEGFAPEDGPEHFGVRARAKEGARVIYRWEDGTPAAVVWQFGKSTVAWLGAGPGQVYNRDPALRGMDELGMRLLYLISGRTAALPRYFSLAQEQERRLQEKRQRAMSSIARNVGVEPPAEYVFLNEDAFGRFGWVMNREGNSVETFHADGVMETSTFCKEQGVITRKTEASRWRLLFDRNPHLRAAVADQTWIFKRYGWTDRSGAEILHSTISSASPAMLWEGDARTVKAIVDGGITHFAWKSGDTVKIADGKGEHDAAGMSANWILLFNAGDENDVPRLLVLTRKPRRISASPQGIAIEFEGGFGALWTIVLFGIESVNTSGWTGAIPGETLEAIEMRSRSVLHYPVDCDELAWIDGTSTRTSAASGPFTMSMKPPARRSTIFRLTRATTATGRRSMRTGRRSAGCSA